MNEALPPRAKLIRRLFPLLAVLPLAMIMFGRVFELTYPIEVVVVSALLYIVGVGFAAWRVTMDQHAADTGGSHG